MIGPRLRRAAIERGALLALTIGILYVWIAPVHIVDGDNAEFATLGALGGAAHPSGYPLYVLWLRAMSWLPGASPAHTAALATALLGTLLALVLHAACRAWGARPLAATAAVALFAAGPVVLRMGTEAEVFALNGVIVAAVLWLAARGGPLRGGRRAFALGLVAGLGMSNHLTCTLAAPVGLLGVVRASREARPPAAIALALLGLALGLTPYLYLLVAPDTPMSWGAVRDLDGLVAMVTRRDYGGPLGFRVAAVEVSPWASLAAFATTVGRAWLWLPPVIGVAVLAWRVARSSDGQTDGETRVGWAMLALSWLVAGPLLVLRFNVPPEGLGLYVCQRFHILPALLLAIPIAVGASRLAARAGSRTQLASVLLATLGFAAAAGASLPYVGRVHGPAVELSAQNMLRSLPAGAVVIHGQDELHAATGYVQAALGVRDDVVVITWTMTALRWYRERGVRRDLLPERGYGDLRTVAAHILARGRPLFVDRFQRDIIASFPSYPYGILIRVLPRGAALPSDLEVLAQNRELYARFALDYPRPGMHDEYATEVHRRYGAIWEMIGKKLAAGGNPVEAEKAFELARQLSPR